MAVAAALKQAGHSLVSLQQLDGPCRYGDTPAWLASMRELIEDWLTPLIASARSLEVDISIYPCNGLRYHLGHNNKLNISKLIFWKKKGRLQNHVETQ